MQAIESQGEIEFTLGARAGRRGRVVRQELRLKGVTVGHGGSWCDGCQARQLASLGKIERALKLFKVVFWRIERMLRLGRTCPNLPAFLMFDPDEIRAAYVLTKKPPPPAPPSLNEVVRRVAMLGGSWRARAMANRASRRYGSDCNVS